MAVVNYSTVEFPDAGVIIVTWPNMANGDTGQPYGPVASYQDKTFQAYGTFGAAGSVAVRGTLETSGFTEVSALNKPDNLVIALITTARIATVLENVLFILPAVTAGDGATSITVKGMFATPARAR